MENHTLHIKNMVCPRCIRVVTTQLQGLGLHPEQVTLGEATLRETVDSLDKEPIRKALEAHGFGLLEDRKAWMVQKIKDTVVELVHYGRQTHLNYSHLIAGKLGMDYAWLSASFSAAEGITIEKYIILQRIERVKELLVYDELTLSQIAGQLGYSSVQHLSGQFRKVTGLTPSHFKKMKEQKRRPLDEI